MLKVLLFVSVAMQIGSFAKAKHLAMLSFVPFTGKEPSNGRACAAAMEFVANRVNANAHFLPGYNLKLHFEDETRSAFATPRAFVRSYLDKYESAPNETYMAPTVLGPSISCQHVAPLLKVNNFIEFSPNCNGMLLVGRRSRFSNLYRVQSPATFSAVAAMLLARRVGKWRQTAVMTYSLNANEYLMAEQIQKNAAENGLELVHYANEPEFTLQVVSKVKESGARMVILAIGQPSLCLQFLCFAHQIGMRGGQYAFTLLYFCTFQPESPALILPRGCTKEMLVEQLQITFWAGIPAMAAGNYGETPLGYDLNEFETEIANYSTFTDFDQRHICHDVALAGALVLNNTETELRNSFNLTLSDFHTNSKLIGTVANQSAASLDFNSLRIGRTKYDRTLEVNEDMWIGQYQDTAYRLLYRIERTSDLKSEFNLSGYKLTASSKFTPRWLTRTGLPPKDLSDVNHRILTNNKESAAILTSLSIVFFLVQISTAVKFCLFQRERKGNVFASFVNCLLLAGCLFLNIGSIIASLGPIYFSLETCQSLPIFMSLGTTLVNSCLVFRLTIFSAIAAAVRSAQTCETSAGSSNARSRSNPRKKKHILPRMIYNPALALKTAFVTAPNIQMLEVIIRDGKLRFLIGVSSSFLVNTFLLTLWLAVLDPVKLKSTPSSVLFDAEADQYYDETSLTCHSEYLMFWIGALLIFNVLILVMGCFLAFRTRNTLLPTEFVVACQSNRLAVLNASTSFLASLLLVVIVPPSKYVMSQYIVISICQMFYAMTSFGFIAILPMLKRSHSRF